MTFRTPDPSALLASGPSNCPWQALDIQQHRAGREAVSRTPGRTGASGPDEQGYLHCGPTGAGHFVKMVHNGIEYGMMAAYAEGLNILKHADVDLLKREKDAETTPCVTRMPISIRSTSAGSPRCGTGAALWRPDCSILLPRRWFKIRISHSFRDEYRIRARGVGRQWPRSREPLRR